MNFVLHSLFKRVGDVSGDQKPVKDVYAWLEQSLYVMLDFFVVVVWCVPKDCIIILSFYSNCILACYL